ncbi:D-alanyl-D-alanine carboxypeptidase family protein [Thioalkalicoccus limnaeus]|uniref:serine-type D-Ala-D-Ala carboxypeptidase n=1 Tax=Thioalkalicoccus limnaeus TaxID=120681 RepID=A0ABV4BDC8_9GAMM
MKQRMPILAILVGFLIWPVVGWAQALVPDPPSIGAKSYLVMDHQTGEILVEHNADERVEPASLTKILTAYTVFREVAAGKLSLHDEVLVSEKAWRTPGSRTFIEVGTRVTIEDLLMGMIVQSGNDASVALAEHVGGSEAVFADLMNAHARRLGARNSHFANATGLPHPELYTTARDIALITSALISEFPDDYLRYSVREFTFNNIKQPNRNRLLARDDSVDGVKTGYTDAAGYCLVTSARREGRRLVTVVMGSKGPEQRAQESLALLNYGFRFFESPRLYEGGVAVANLRVWKGATTEVPVGPLTDVHATIPRGRYERLEAGLIPAPVREAPLAHGDILGTIVVTLDGHEINRVPAVALRDVERGGLWRRLVDSVIDLVQR